MQDDNDSDCSNETYPPRASPSKMNEKDLSTNERMFIMALPHCLPLDYGFHVKHPTNSEICFCPCGKSVAPWRNAHQVDVDVVCKRNKRNIFTPKSIIDHLKTIGGGYDQGNHKETSQRTVTVLCMFHYSAAEYLRKLHYDDNF